MTTKKQEAIELLKKETTDLANVYKKDGGFVLSGTYEQEEIGPGDYFIARKPKNPLEGLPWIDAMDKFDGVIQKCASVDVRGCVLSENTFMDTWWYDPSWCKKVSPGDVMKTGKHTVFIFKKLKNGEIFDYAFYSENVGLIIDENTSTPNPLHLPFSHATPEEAQTLFDALAKEGKRWNAEKKCIEDKPKDKTIPKSTPSTYEEILRSWGCSDEEIMLQKKVDEAYEKTLKLLQEASKEYIVSVKEAVTELKTGDMYEGLVAIADSYAGSPSFGKKDALKQVIKLCKKLLNE